MARAKRLGKDIGPSAVRYDGPIFPVKDDADKTAKKNGKRVVKVKGGWQVREKTKRARSH